VKWIWPVFRHASLSCNLGTEDKVDILRSSTVVCLLQQ
jgi:hypothetical protein